GIAKSHGGEWVDEVATRAAAQNEQYLELMHTPDFGVALRLAAQHAWNGDPAQMRETLLGAGLRDNIAADRAEFDAMDNARKAREHCGTATASPSCKVEVRYIYQVLRSAEPARVFAQTLLGFELASVDPRVVGINFVQPEDAYLAMSQYRTQMDMLHYLRSVYPKVHLSLHAGELSPGMVPPEGLRFHIHDAVDQAGAERIGHGVDVLYETDAQNLLQTMAQRHVMVEINLTSNDVILGIRGKDHSLGSYLAAGVPVALSTDDEGVSRIDLTHEYKRAVLEQGLTYTQLKASARTSLEHAFLPGASLWSAPDAFTSMQKVCAGIVDAQPGSPCSAFLATSERAQQQWELEQRFRRFEAATPKLSLTSRKEAH
ncbi:MAG: adenosine deaminase family protein, partial [Janthinobacterium lividum]